jgi:hypothetical protein
MYLRFVFAEAEPKTRRRVGIYQSTLWELRSDLLGGLPYPPRRAFSGGRGVCWFKLTARRFIDDLRELASRLEARGSRIWQIYCRHPGLMTYEDDYQIVAVPDSARFPARR